MSPTLPRPRLRATGERPSPPDALYLASIGLTQVAFYHAYFTGRLC